MTNENMKSELEKHDIVDNPFDVMLYHAMEMTRDLLFACHRLKDARIPEQFCINEEKLENYMDKIMYEFSKLSNMSDETVAMCRETSHFYQQDKFNKMNETILSLENEMETIWNRCVPNRNNTFERIRLGEESEEYKRLLELRHIIQNSEELSSVNESYLHSLCDVITRPNECTKHWMSQKELEEKQKIIKKYHLSTNDVEYMISYRKHLIHT